MPSRPLLRLSGPTSKAAVIVLALFLAGCGGGADEVTATGEERAEQVRDAVRDAGLDDEVGDFLALLGRGETATYRVRFPGPAEGTELEVTSRPPDRRVELTADGRIADLRLVTDGQAFACSPTTQEPDAPMSCERTDSLVDPPGVFSERALDELRTSLAGRVEDYAFDVEGRTVAGVEAECLVTRLRSGRGAPERGAMGTICASPEGAVLLVDQDGERLEALEYSTSVGADAFVRPDAPGREDAG